MPQRSAHARRTLLALSGLVIAAGPVWGFGQIQANGDGRALDANPGVGSGGSNRIENAIDFQARNDLVTNNVAGGFGFQGDSGFLAPGAFQGGLGSDDLQGFRQESFFSAPNVANLNTRGQFNNQGRNVVVFDQFTSVPSNRITNNSTTTLFDTDGGSFRVAPIPGNNNPFEITLNRRNDLIDTSFNRAPLNAVGFTRQADGSALAVTVDPLTGVSQRAVRSTNQRSAEARDLQRNLYGLTDPENPNDPTAGNLPRQADRIDLSGATPTTFITPRAFGGQGQLNSGDATGLQNRDRFTDATGLIKPTLQLGQLATNPRSAGVVTLEQRVKNIQDSIFGPTPGSAPGRNGTPGNATTPGTPGATGPDGRPAGPENAYTKLLDEIRIQSQQTAEERAASSDPRFDARPDWMKALDEPTNEQVDQAEEGLAETLARIRAGQNGNDDSTDGSTTGEGEDAERRDEANARLDALMDDLSYSVRVETLVAEREGRLNDLFKQGEEQLAAGKFLNAERTYRQIRLEAGDNPLGQAGLIHAQLGGGMVRSAAFNLRGLFESHPELVATRYGQNLLPPAERLEWLQTELQRMIDSETSGTDPGLMLAYLGHQVESRQLVRYGLAIAEEASPLDPLLPVLRRIWLDQKPAPAPGSTPGNADGGK